MTLEGWTDTMYLTAAAVPGPAPYAYSISLVCVGSLYALNLMLAVLLHAYRSQPRACDADASHKTSHHSDTARTATLLADAAERRPCWVPRQLHEVCMYIYICIYIYI